MALRFRSGQKIYLVLNKPRGVVTTASDEKGRKTVYTCLGDDFSWTAPVGRLDKASEGLLLFSNDSEWSARLLAPESHLDKTYHVQIDTIADESLVRKMENGARTAEGDFLRAKKASVLREGKRNSWIEVVLDEGKNRHIRRLLEHLDIEVLRLVRVAMGPLVLGRLAKGEFRHLSPQEKLMLDHAVGAGNR